MGDGNGWVVCALGHRHWGRYGAAGLLVSDGAQAILQHRAPWTHEGDTWGLPGGARDSHEDVVQAAVREAIEEANIVPQSVTPFGLLADEHGGWSYTTVLALPRQPIAPHPANEESSDVRWWPVAAVAALPLHRGFAATWPIVSQPPKPLTIVVDAANVIGSRPDGWWRDRAGATRRLLDRLRTTAAAGLAPPALPGAVHAGALSTLLPRFRVVLEGAAARVAQDAGRDGQWWSRQVTVHAAPHDGDAEVVRQVALARAAGDQIAVVSADRGLRTRVESAAVTVGPSWLLDLLPVP